MRKADPLGGVQVPLFRSLRSRSSLVFVVLMTLAALLTLVAVTAIPAGSAIVASSIDREGLTAGVVHGRVVDRESQPRGGIFVTAVPVAGGPERTVITDAEGQYRLPILPAGQYELRADAPGWFAAEPHPIAVEAGEAETRVEIVLGGPRRLWGDAPSSALLSQLPDGEEKRRFILDCTGCHPFDHQTAGVGARLKTRGEWRERVAQMISFSGAESSFPIMSPGRAADSTSMWLSMHLGPEPMWTDAPDLDPLPDVDPAAVRSLVTEYELPVPSDLPHDLMVDVDGRVVVTGMLSGSMYLLDPESGEFEAHEIPVAGGNPRAIDIDREGNWYVLLGNPRKLARRDRATEEWHDWNLAMYPHSIQLDGGGRLWFNGHFTRDPERIGYADTRTGEVVTIDVPVEAMPDGGRTIQYGLRTGPDGSVWTTQLVGGRLIRYEPGSGEFRLYDLPTPFSGPRRPDVDARGVVWIPEYANNRLARFDPATEAFQEFELPITDALPYVVRVDRRRDLVWIGTAAADALLRFDPAMEQFAVFPLPTHGALIRHIDIDEATGDVWAAYGASPARTPNKVARLQVR
jgi:virginiamycin B lyase